MIKVQAGLCRVQSDVQPKAIKNYFSSRDRAVCSSERVHHCLESVLRPGPGAGGMQVGLPGNLFRSRPAHLLNSCAALVELNFRRFAVAPSLVDSAFPISALRTGRSHRSPPAWCDLLRLKPVPPPPAVRSSLDSLLLIPPPFRTIR